MGLKCGPSEINIPPEGARTTKRIHICWGTWPSSIQIRYGHRYQLYPHATGIYLYLVAIIDLYSRYVLNWNVSDSMDAQWCRETLEETKGEHETGDPYGPGEPVHCRGVHQLCFGSGNTPEHGRQGKGHGQCLYRKAMEKREIEKIYLNPPRDGMDLYLLMAEHFYYYKYERRHQSIDYERPIDLFKRAAS